MPIRSFIRRLLLSFLLCLPALCQVAAAADRKPVAEVLGKPVHDDELVPRTADAEQKAKLATAGYATWRERTREAALRNLVWSAVFADFAKLRQVEPTTAEVDSQIRSQQRFMVENQMQREKQRADLIAELKTAGPDDPKRRQAQQHLDTLNSLLEHDRRIAQERREPGREKMWQDSERRVATVWVRQWKVNQALFREFGGRIVFQQAGWEPIDAYRALLDRYAAERRFVVHDLSLQDAVYRYFRHKFVYADEAKAKFYFEKPYWERTQQEMRAAGF